MYEKKKNKSGVISVQVIDKSSGKYKVIKTIGSSPVDTDIEMFYQQGGDYIWHYEGQQTFDFSAQDFKETVKQSIRNISIEGVHLLIERIYADSDYKEALQQISYEHTKKVLGGIVSVVFYDVTTIYFQIDNEDDVRKRGFSKEGRHQNPQIVLGLLVGVLAYDIHEGNKFEGHTMLPIIDAFKNKYDLEKLVVVADSGLLSSSNVKDLQEKGYEFILGARIKNESKSIKEKILALNLEDKSSAVIPKTDGTRLIVGYTEKRAKKEEQVNLSRNNLLRKYPF